MKKNYFLVLLILLVLFVIGWVTGIFTIEKGPPNTDFPVQIKICDKLSEEECFNNDNCVGGYGPSSCIGNKCTADLVFKSCGPSGLNSDEIQQIKTECSKIDGEFKKDRFGGYECLCTKPNYIGKDRCLEDLITQIRTN